MFSEYLRTASDFLEAAEQEAEEARAKRQFQAAILFTASAVESFVNYIGDTLAKSKNTPLHEAAFLTDRELDISKGKFAISQRSKYYRLEDKLKYLVYKFCKNYSIEKAPEWPKFLEFKRFRDELVHPKRDEDDRSLKEYKNQTIQGLEASITIMNEVCIGVFSKPLRKKVLDLRPD